MVVWGNICAWYSGGGLLDFTTVSHHHCPVVFQWPLFPGQVGVFLLMQGTQVERCLPSITRFELEWPHVLKCINSKELKVKSTDVILSSLWGSEVGRLEQLPPHSREETTFEHTLPSLYIRSVCAQVFTYSTRMYVCICTHINTLVFLITKLCTSY